MPEHFYILIGMSLGSIRQKRNMILILKGETVLDGILKLTLWILIIQVKDMNIYHNLGVRNAISDLKLDAKWYDHVSWLVPVIGPIGVGIYNSSTR